MLNSCKRAITLDLKHERGKALLRELVTRADVLLENFAPGVMDKLGVGWDVLRPINPALIYATGSGFGISGPDRDNLAMDFTIQAMSGIMSTTGAARRPADEVRPDAGGHDGRHRAVRRHPDRAVRACAHRPGPPGGNLDAGNRVRNDGLADGVFPPHRRRSRRATATARPAAPRRPTTPIRRTTATWSSTWSPRNTGPKLLEAMGRPGPDRRRALRDARKACRAERRGGRDRRCLDAHARPVRGVQALASRHRIPCAPVRNVQEAMEDPHMHERGMLEWIDHPELGRIVVPTTPLRIHGTDKVRTVPSPLIGEHNHEIYGEWLGLSTAEIDGLRAEGVI